MKKKYVFPLETLVELRSFFHGKREEIALKANMHYNSVGNVLKGEYYNERILKAMIEILEENPEDEYAISLSKKVGKLLKSKQKNLQTA
jgi:hypothetical protein